jgi:hypothetical protein
VGDKKGGCKKLESGKRGPGYAIAGRLFTLRYAFIACSLFLAN